MCLYYAEVRTLDGQRGAPAAEMNRFIDPTAARKPVSLAAHRCFACRMSSLDSCFVVSRTLTRAGRRSEPQSVNSEAAAGLEELCHEEEREGNQSYAFFPLSIAHVLPAYKLPCAAIPFADVCSACMASWDASCADGWCSLAKPST